MTVTVPTLLLEEFRCEAGKLLAQAEESRAASDRAWDAAMQKDAYFQSRLAKSAEESSTIDERLKKKGELYAWWRENNHDLRPPAIIPDETMIIVELQGVPKKRPSDTGGYNQKSTKSCTIPFEGKELESFIGTVRHEIGHAVGLAPQPESPQSFDQSKTFYKEHGHRGSHCHFGTHLADYASADNVGTCTMFGSSSRRQEVPLFCPVCAGAVFRGDYSEGFVATTFGDASGAETTRARLLQEQRGDVRTHAQAATRRWNDLREAWNADRRKLELKKAEAEKKAAAAEDVERVKVIGPQIEELNNRFATLTREEKVYLRQLCQEALEHWELQDILKKVG